MILISQLLDPYFGFPAMTTTPISQAGHQTHHTTIPVRMPQTLHPKAASLKTVTTGISQYQLPARTTVPGVSRLSRSPESKAAGWEDIGRTKLKGAERRPIIKAREKLRVARDERNMPNSRREKDVSNVYCWAVGLKLRIRILEATKGRITLTAQNPMNT